MTFQLETRNVLIYAPHQELARDLAQEMFLEKYIFIDDPVTLRNWGVLGGITKDNAVIWLAGNYSTGRHFVYLLYKAMQFEITIIDMNEMKIDSSIMAESNTRH